MPEQGSKQEFRERLEEQLNSPLPLLIQLRNFVFGKEKPDNYTRFSFFFALIIWFVFLLWSILGMVVIGSRYWIESEKKIEVTKMIQERGQELGFEGVAFAERLDSFHTISIFCWIVTFAGLVMLYRKNARFIYPFYIGTGLYFLLMIFMLGFGYWANDTTLFDKITFFLMLGHTGLYYFFLKQEIEGNPTNFFGIKEDDNYQL